MYRCKHLIVLHLHSRDALKSRLETLGTKAFYHLQ